ncbi:alpha/beta fold hydrolase [Paucibacter sp. AS339]|uniref:alpha/beta fold hydrolase n=1 Tax=Paucibacter hankyongi TaxID=3133434 RepID=UPI0030A9C123
MCAALLLSGASGALAQATVAHRTDGTQISARVDLPAGNAKVPALVLAPGQGYHMSLPAMEATARALSERGVAVFRFNWTYFTAEPKGQPSPDLSLELQDLQAVVAAARAHPRVDPQNITVGGKSLGSVVAWRAFVADQKLRSALLLTPLCSRVPKGETTPRPEGRENYPGLEAERRPSLWIAGDADPLCDPVALYALAAGGQKALRVAIVGGDHSFENRALAAAEADEFRAGNLRAVSALAAGFVDPVSRPRP